MNATAFNQFHHTWFDQLHLLTSHLSTLLATPHGNKSNEYHQLTHQLVDRAIAHYTDLFRAKSAASLIDVLALFSAPWASSVERMLHWVTGFLPTTVFHLIYTESSARFESHMASFLSGRRTGDLGELTATQLTQVSELQYKTVVVENEISGRLSEWQDGQAESDWLSAASCGDVERLKKVVEAADELNMATLRRVVGMLSPRQAVEFLVAFSELQFGIRSWGLEQDRALPAAALGP